MSEAEIIHVSKYPSISIPTDVSLTDFILEKIATKTTTEGVAFVDSVTGQEITYAEFPDLVNHVAKGFSDLGFVKGDVLCIFLPNLVHYAVIFHGFAKIGGICSTSNPLYTAEELTHQLKNSGSTAVFTVGAFLPVVLEAAQGAGIDKVFTLEGIEGTTSYASLLENDGNPPTVEINPVEDPVAMPYSSGTTGLSKGVVLTHYNIISNLLQLHASEGQFLQQDDVYVGILPFFHIYGLVVIMHHSMFCGYKTVVITKFDFGPFLGTIQAHRISILHIVPPIVLALAKVPAVDQFDMSSVRVIFSGAAPLGGEIEGAVKSRQTFSNVIVKQGYGMTELSPVSHVVPQTHLKSGTVGWLVCNMEAKILDIETGKTLGINEEGEICLRGPNVMKEYLNNPEATANTIDQDGFLHTGDLGKVDEDGHFTVTDRLKELIKYKGFQVPPAELEALLLGNPDILDCAVIGVPDLEAGELPKAFVVPRPDSGLTEEAVYDWVKEHVAPHKRLKGGVEFINEIPKSKAGKILRRILRDRE